MVWVDLIRLGLGLGLIVFVSYTVCVNHLIEYVVVGRPRLAPLFPRRRQGGPHDNHNLGWLSHVAVRIGSSHSNLDL